MELKKPSSKIDSFSENPPSGALPLLHYLTNAVFFAAAYFLLVSWRDKIRHSKPLHVVTLSEIVALLAFAASSVYLLAFFGFASIFVQPLQQQGEQKQIPLKKKENDHPPPLKLDLSKSSILRRRRGYSTSKVKYGFCRGTLSALMSAIAAGHTARQESSHSIQYS